jgi:hypothetical protein
MHCGFGPLYTYYQFTGAARSVFVGCRCKHISQNRHVLKGETSKRNDRNETAETIETTETTERKRPKRNDRNETAENINYTKIKKCGYGRTDRRGGQADGRRERRMDGGGQADGRGTGGWTGGTASFVTKLNFMNQIRVF